MVDDITMAKPSPINPLCYVNERQFSSNFTIKNKLYRERFAVARNLYRKDLLAHYGCVNAIEFSKEGELLISGGDDRRVLLWSIPQVLHGCGNPISMQTSHISNIFCLGFDSKNTKIFSGGNDDQVILHDLNTGLLIVKVPHKKPVYGLSVNPQNDNVFATAGDDGRVLVFDFRESMSNDAICLAKQKTGFHSVMFNPLNPRWLATANSEEGIALWDCRKPREQLIHFDSTAGSISGISASFNSNGTQILALRRRLPPVLYSTQQENAICQFYHPQYYNSCTMKTCCFAGEDDEYILSGSDDFNLYMWKIPEQDAEWGSSHLVLKGHRSIVNQVRYNKQNNIIASSGVEKMVKLWSTLPVGTWKGSLLRENQELLRTIYTHEEYIYLVGSGGEQRISHDYSEHSTNEDCKMMAFFDSLIQREIEGWDSVEQEVSSDSESDGQIDDYTALAKTMFLNTKNGNDNNKKYKLNKIEQLISKKKAKLAKMARAKSSSYLLRNKSKDKSKKRNGYHKYKSKTAKSNGNIGKKSSKKSLDKNPKKTKSAPDVNKYKKYKTRQNNRESVESSTSLDGPSTSTGITSSSSSVYRVVDQDSDEEIPNNHITNENVDNEEEVQENLISILPTPLNGTHDLFVNALEMTTPTRSVTLSSGSNAGGSRVALEVQCAAASGLNGTHSESDSDYEINYVTPVKKRRTISASDSGFGTGGPSSSVSAYLKSPVRQNSCSSEDEFTEKFRKRVKKARLNIRKQIAADSDSN